MSKLIGHIATRLRAWVGNRREAERHEVEVEAKIQARLLLSVSLPHAEEKSADARRPSKLIGSTRNVSEDGLAIVLPSLRIGPGLIIEENCILRIVLDIYPVGLVEMDGVVVHQRRFDEKETDAGYLVGVRIGEMSEGDRARYLEYLGTLERRAPAPGTSHSTSARLVLRARH